MIEVTETEGDEGYGRKLVATVDGEHAGHLSYTVPAPNRAQVLHLVVKDEFRLQGVATALMQGIWDRAPEAVWVRWSKAGREAFRPFQEAHPEARVSTLDMMRVRQLPEEEDAEEEP